MQLGCCNNIALTCSTYGSPIFLLSPSSAYFYYFSSSFLIIGLSPRIQVLENKWRM